MKDATTEEPISPECRRAICLYRLARGNYYYTLSEMSGLGTATIQGIVTNELISTEIRRLNQASAAHGKTLNVTTLHAFTQLHMVENKSYNVVTYNRITDRRV